MKHSLSIIAFTYLLAISNAAKVTFNVIAPGANDVQVSINGQNTKLNAKDADVPVFSGDAEIPDDGKYKYIVGGVAEEFDRSVYKGRTSTLNDFFQRPITYANIPELPWPIKDNAQWTRGGKPTALFDSNYIPSVFINGDKAALDNIIATVPKDLSKVKFTLVDAESVHSFNNVEFGIHGAGKKKNNAKQSWKWKLSGTDTLYNRNYFKIRHMEEDPTQIREKLYSDVLIAMGSYVNEANMIRLFINNEFMGTFNLLDDVTEYSYVNARFFGGKPPQEKGPLYDGASGASFLYSPTGDYFSFKPNAEGPAGGVALLDPICKLFNETKYEDDASIAKFSEQFDVDQFLRFMVMEYLGGHWDGYWQMQTNDGAFQDPTDKKWYYLGQDFDATFGVNIPDVDYRGFVNVPYTEYPTRYPNAILINNLLKNPKIKATFDTYIKDTVSILFNNVTLTNRILAYHEFILPDLKWDRSVKQRSPGIDFGWTFEQVTQNLYQAVESPNLVQVGKENSTGGAGWGLIEWIAAKSQAVAKEYQITITDKPVFPPTNNSIFNQTNNANNKNGDNKNGDNKNANDKNSSAKDSSAATTLAVPSALLIVSLAALSLI
ncbi:unnamed protein product [Cunninghamella blakesleeana]